MSWLAVGSGLIGLLLPVAVVVLIVRLVARRDSAHVGGGHGVRRFFQYLLLLALGIVVASGLVGLVDLLVAPPSVVDTSGALARALTFVVIGGPILAALVVWTRREARTDPLELGSFGWAAYVTLGALIALSVAMVGLYDVTRAALGGVLDRSALATLVVWGGMWWLHQELDRRTLTPAQRRPHLLLGTLVGWVVSVIGLVLLLAVALSTLVVPERQVLVGTTTLVPAAAVLVAGAPVWAWYWLTRFGRTPVDLWTLAYVLPLGVGASLVMTVTGASIVLDRALVWLFGDPGAASGGAYLARTATPVSVAVVGALSWWYHRDAFAARAPRERTEPARVHEYLLAAIALVAAGTGVALAISALLEAVAPGKGALVGGMLNPVLAAITLLVVGGPLWWWFWSRIVRARAAAPSVEAASPTRRVYLVLLFGVAGVVAVVVVLIGAFMMIDAVLGSSLGAGTLLHLRAPLGILIATAAISGYHWAVYREDRGLLATAAVRSGPSEVLLVGPRDDALVAQLRRATGARVQGWAGDGSAWDPEAVLAAVRAATRPQVLVLWDQAGVRVVEAGAGSAEGQA